MDLTPEGVRGAKFRTQAVRGYNCADVDDFVEQMAAGLAELLEQVTSFSGRAARAEREVEDLRITEAALRQTLGHAQSTADEILHAARTEADRVVREAEQRRAALLAETEFVAGREATVDRDVRAEVERLHDARQVLQGDIDVLVQHLAAECQRARSMLEDALAALDSPPAAPQPRLHQVRLPELPPPVESPWMTAVFGARGGLAAAGTDPPGAGGPGGDVRTGANGWPDPVRRLGPPLDASGIAPAPPRTAGDDVFAPQPEPRRVPPPWAPGPAVAAPGQPPDAAFAPPALLPALAVNAPPVTEAHPPAPVGEATVDGAGFGDDPQGGRVLGGNLSDDDFLAELRLAASSTEPLGPSQPDDQSRDAVADEEFGQDVSEPSRRGGRLRRRR
jgi:DivIVA domain-containing protein